MMNEDKARKQPTRLGVTAQGETHGRNLQGDANAILETLIVQQEQEGPSKMEAARMLAREIVRGALQRKVWFKAEQSLAVMQSLKLSPSCPVDLKIGTWRRFLREEKKLQMPKGTRKPSHLNSRPVVAEATQRAQEGSPKVLQEGRALQHELQETTDLGLL